MYIAINNSDWQGVTENNWHPKPIVFVDDSDFGINKLCWLRLTANQVAMVLIVGADTCIQCVLGSNPTDY